MHKHFCHTTVCKMVEPSYPLTVAWVNKSQYIHAIDDHKNDLTITCNNINTSYTHNIERIKIPNKWSQQYILNDSTYKIQK